jgi:pimeloyl-ACP methyl ester carboxylesterase
MTSATSGFLRHNGAHIYYEVEGDGEPVLFIHAGVANLRMWDDQAAALGARYRVVRFDTRGYGRTESEHVEFSNRADAAAVLDEVGEDSAHVVGLSRGGQIALDFVLERPDRTRSLTVVAGGIGGFEPEVRTTVDWDEVEGWWEAKDWQRLTDFEVAYWVDGPCQSADRVDPDVRARVAEWISTNYRAEKEEGVPQVLDPPAATRLGDLRVPLLVIVGQLDDDGTKASMRYLADRVPGARIESFATAHMVNLEEPQRFNEVLGAFLDEVSSRAQS